MIYLKFSNRLKSMMVMGSLIFCMSVICFGSFVAENHGAMEPRPILPQQEEGKSLDGYSKLNLQELKRSLNKQPASKELGEKAEQSDVTGQKTFQKNGLEVSVSMEPTEGQDSQKRQLLVKLSIPDGYHIYGSNDSNFPTTIQLTGDDTFAHGEIMIPAGEAHGDGSDKEHWLTGTHLINIPIQLADKIKGGLTITGNVQFVICDKNGCQPPATLEFTTSVQVDDDSSRRAAILDLLADGLPELRKSAEKAQEHHGVGKPAPDIVGEDLEGVEFRLSDYRGKVVLLEFWGDW